MSNNMQFFLGISPILFIMIGTICAGAYAVFRKLKNHRH